MMRVCVFRLMVFTEDHIPQTPGSVARKDELVTLEDKVCALVAL